MILLTDFVTEMLYGIDLDKYDFLVPLISSVILILCLGVTFRSLLTIFNIFFK